jgi:2-polyprenyl-6-methoxyphenol hydroxylase-like FAD-dependent oxidoreductase
MNPMRSAPVEVTGGFRDGDEVFDTVTGRRPVFEAIVARLTASTPGVTVRRGTPVAGLVTGDEAMPGIPHVVGVRTEAGATIAADLVVDMTGRRSPLPRWLEAIGARAPDEQLEDSGFVYYGRHFRSGDGSIPVSLGPLLQGYGSLSVLCLPADNGTWGVGVITSAGDPALRALKATDTWMRVVRSFPLVAHWVDAEPLDEKPAVMAKIEDRRRRFVVDGAPVATGVVAVADSWACTNPSLGRGMSIGLIHAIALRDLLRNDVPANPGKLALAWNDVTDATVLPWYRATLHFDRHRLAEIDAAIRGEDYDPGDPVWEMTKALECASMRDPECLRGFLSIASLVKSGDQLFSEPGFAERVIEHGGDWRSSALPGPDREQLLQIVAG